MPDPYERHGRSADPFSGSQPSRSQQRSAARAEQQERRRPAKKDPAMCKAAHWRGPHQAEMRIRQFGWRHITARCLWTVSWRSPDGKPSWHCAHEESCAGCGKVLRTSIPDGECPDFHPITEGERAAIATELAERGPRKITGRQITGRQGYRKPKSPKSA